ncbi:kinesin-like protein KIF3A isoform X1 [Diorhabda sublineata]|uniref:kinesin-like protein KIF3A isoform X1 n=1 Tax=Diorhabda sublineata TaxID=1163346 RepID=UPI0024E12543|nr:kinesin-like protein KIF3A isoform X1 [Diorhabda sublineata]
MENGTGLEYQQSQENVRVFIRVRPLSKKELSEGNENIVLCDYRENLIALRKNGEHTKPFKFDHIFGLDTTQLEMYKMTAFPIVDKVLEGYNGTVFAYGQTGTGKTYTMVGNHLVPELKGIVPNTFSHIFSQIARASEEKSFVVKATYLEIYNEEVRDLLAQNPTKKLAIRERKDIGVYVKDLMGFTVDSIQAVTELINRGNKNRITRSTLMNDVSSRSHAIFTVTIESKNRQDNKTTVGKLNLVDLAGSERASRTQATGERLKEASNINLSLSVLGNVISALVDGKSTHIPYRNSKLTRLLQDSLGGNSKTAMIAMISPADIDYEESMCTLRYASRVKFIKNCVKINVEEKGLIEGFELEIAELKDRLAQLSVMEQRREQKRKDRAVSAEEKERFKQTAMELERTEKIKNELEEKVALIQKKILVGGENLLEKAQQQAFFLESSAAELENLDRSHQHLEEQLNKKTLEKIDVEEQYSSLQEEDVGLTKKLKKVQLFIKEAKEEHSDKEREYQRDLEALYDNNRLLVRETQLANLILDNYIPSEYLKKIQYNMIWSNDGQEYQMRGVAYTGNNMRKRQNTSAETLIQVRFDMKQPFHKYPERKKEKSRDKRQLPKSLSAAPKSHNQI